MGPYSSLPDRLEFLARMVVPYAFMLLVFFLGLVSVPYPLAAFFKAPLLLMAVYYWSIYRPTLIPPWLVFVGGFLFDLIAGAPYTGLSALLFLFCRIFVVDQRRFLTGQAFPVVWIGFCALDIAVHLLQWCMFSALSAAWIPFQELSSSMLLGIVTFPLFYLFLHMTHKILPEPVRRSKSRLASQKSDMTL
ncbi:MAG: rod shape-determining protein MreD [Alphaproteobacteria bacterium]